MQQALAADDQRGISEDDVAVGSDCLARVGACTARSRQDQRSGCGLRVAALARDVSCPHNKAVSEGSVLSSRVPEL